MTRHRRIHVESPRTGGGAVLGLLAVVLLSAGALGLQANESEPRTARTVFVDQTPWDPAAQKEAELAEIPAPAIDGVVQSFGEDEILVSSVEPETMPLCNVNACANAYRSFRVSDCTFQPYEGPRKLCSR